tara:strand:- start:924 stop:1094 length:171 start_codon:yes stop_codon:yes gene_type:complete
MKYQVIYIPRVEDEIAVAQYHTKEDADHHMEYIKNRQPRVLEYHYIKEVEEDYYDK